MITFKSRFNKDWWKEHTTNREHGKYEVAMYDGRELAAICGFSAATEEPVAMRAAEMQRDYDFAIGEGHSHQDAYDYAHSGKPLPS